MKMQQYRGIASFEVNDQFIVVQAPINLVSEALNQTKQIALWERDVYGREVNFVGQGLIVFQFRGHVWTLIHNWNFPSYSSLEGKTDAQALSCLLNTCALYYSISDTSYYIGYELYDKGVSVEKFEYIDGESQFESQLRQLEEEDIGDPFDFTNMFMKEHDICIPALLGTQFRVGPFVNVVLTGLMSTRTSQAINFLKSDFERVDHLTVVKASSQGTAWRDRTGG